MLHGVVKMNVSMIIACLSFFYGRISISNIIMLLFVLTTSAFVHSSNQNAGSASSASIGISLFIPPRLFLDTTTDTVIYTAQSKNEINHTIPLCVYSNTPALYSITIEDPKNKENDNFTIKNDKFSLPYTVMLQQTPQSSWMLMTSNSTSQKLPTLSNGQSCYNSPNITFRANPLPLNENLTGTINLTINTL